MFAPAVSFMDAEFHNSSLLLSSLTVSIFVCGYVIGPLILAPLSEIYGRRVVLTGANAFFCVWQIGCALAPDIASLIGFRLLAGIGGAGCLTIGGGVISDLFHADRRGFATAIYSVGPLFGPVIGPICGGFIGQQIGWRWVFWILLIAASVVTIGIEIFNKETNPRVLMQRKVKRLQKELNRSDLRSCYDGSGPKLTPSQILWHGIMRPWKMLFLSPIIFLLSLYMAVVYGLLYLLFTTITTVFIETYHWQPDICGLAYIGLGVGFMTGLAVVAKVRNPPSDLFPFQLYFTNSTPKFWSRRSPSDRAKSCPTPLEKPPQSSLLPYLACTNFEVSQISDATVVRMTKANDGVFEPEMRLPSCIFFAFFIPITFFWYGWTADKGVHWIVPIIGLIPFGFGMMGIFIPIQTYTIDSFPTFAASGIAALTVSRSLFGAFLPLAGPSMYASLGLGWGNSVLGFIAIGLIPAPLLIYKFGGRIRKNHPVKL